MFEEEIEVSKRGFPLWSETGGANSNTGSARVIAGPTGERKKALRIARWANGPHAWFVLQEGDHIIMVSCWRKEHPCDRIRIARVVGFNRKKEYGRERVYAVLEPVGEFSDGEWDVEPPDYLCSAIEAARKKVHRYHCREAVYVADGDNP